MGEEGVIDIVARVQTLGRIAIPYEVRELLGIKEGDILRLRILEIKPAERADRPSAVAGEDLSDVPVR